GLGEVHDEAVPLVGRGGGVEGEVHADERHLGVVVAGFLRAELEGVAVGLQAVGDQGGGPFGGAGGDAAGVVGAHAWASLCCGLVRLPPRRGARGGRRRGGLEGGLVALLRGGGRGGGGGRCGGGGGGRGGGGCRGGGLGERRLVRGHPRASAHVIGALNERQQGPRLEARAGGDLADPAQDHAAARGEAGHDA